MENKQTQTDIRNGKKVINPKNHKYQRDKDREMVKGIFHFYEVPGGSMSFVYKQYKEDPVEKFDLVDGQVYTLPLGVAKHLNKNIWYPIHAYMMDENNRPHMRINKKVRRCSFQSLEFVDIDDLSMNGTHIAAPHEDIVTVEKI